LAQFSTTMSSFTGILLVSTLTRLYIDVHVLLSNITFYIFDVFVVQRSQCCPYNPF